MIQTQETKECFGYDADSLTKSSNKKICVICDYCGNKYHIKKQDRVRSNKIVDKDACSKCKYKKRKDVSLKRDGVANSAQRSDVRKKISDNCPFTRKDVQEKTKKTMMKKYGTIYSMQNEDVKKRCRDNIIKKYGVEHISKISEVQDKIKNTNLDKYGNEYFLGSQEGRRRSIEGMQKKYGVDYSLQSKEIREKVRKTNLEKYGVEYPAQSKDILNKTCKTNLEKYGCKCVLQSKEIQNKIKETNLKKYGYDNPSYNDEVIKKILETKIKNGIIKTFEKKTISEWADELNKPYSTFVAQIAKHGFDKACLIEHKDNALEQVIKIWLDETGIEYTRHLRVNGRYTDFIIPSHNIIIETDGLYWHSDLFLDNNYHSQKRKDYMEAEYQPLFFRENEIYNKLDIVKSIILNKLGRSNRIFARKCNITTLSKEKSKTFFKTNHLMGKGRGLTYGLEYEGEVVSAMTLRKVKGYNWEISRFCHKLNTQVVGGFSRLIKNFINENKVDNLMTFIDLRYGSGEYLESLGFKYTTTNLSFNWTDFQDTFHRMKFKGNSGYDYGLYKIWDCGQSRYDLII